MDRDHDADKLAIAGAVGVVPFAFSVLGSWLWPMMNSAGDPVHQQYKITEILIGFVGGGAIGLTLGLVLLFVRSKTETVEEAHH